jgi:hypothetical protein
MDFPHQVEIVEFLVDKLHEHSRPCVLLNESTINTEEPNELICFHSALVKTERDGIREFPNNRYYVLWVMNMISHMEMTYYVGYKAGNPLPSKEYEDEWNRQDTVYRNLSDRFFDVEFPRCDADEVEDEGNYDVCVINALEETELYAYRQFPERVDLIYDSMEYLRLTVGQRFYQFGSVRSRESIRRGGRRGGRRDGCRDGRKTNKKRRTNRRTNKNRLHK